MTHGPTKYAPKKSCIYCGRGDVLLTDEHIVPYSLGGGHVLQKASCRACAAITSAFELEVARNLWGDARSSYGAPTRHKKKKRKTHQVLRDPKGLNTDIAVPMEQYPGVFVFYTMGPAGILLGRDRNEDVSGKWGFSTVVDDARLHALENAHHGRVTASFKNVPVSFGRLLAKIGYCQILCSLDTEDFIPLCLPYILGEESNLSHIIGGRKTIEAPQSGVGYSLKSIQIGNHERLILVVEIRLLANSHVPTYHVVVGEVIGAECVRLVNEKLEATYAVSLSEEFEAHPEPSEEFHWMPRVWPLPLM